MEDIQVRQINWSKENLALSFYANRGREIVAIARRTKEKVNLKTLKNNDCEFITFENLMYTDAETIFDLFLDDGQEQKRLFIGHNIDFKQTYYWVNYEEDVIAIPYIAKSGHLSLYVGSRIELFDKRLKIPTKNLTIKDIVLNKTDQIYLEIPEAISNSYDSRFMYVKVNGKFLRLDELKDNVFSTHQLGHVKQQYVWLRLILESEDNINIYKIFMTSLPTNDSASVNYQLDINSKGEVLLAYSNGLQEYRTFKKQNGIISTPININFDISFENDSIVIDLEKYIRRIYLVQENLDDYLETYQLFVEGSSFSERVQFNSFKGRIIIGVETFQNMPNDLFKLILVQPNPKIPVLKNQHVRLVQSRNKVVSFAYRTSSYIISEKGLQIIDNTSIKRVQLPEKKVICLIDSFTEDKDNIVLTLSKNEMLSNIGIIARESKEFINLPFKQNGKNIFLKKEDILNFVDIYQSKWEFAVEIFDEVNLIKTYKKIKIKNTFFAKKFDRFLSTIPVNQTLIEKYSTIIRNYVLIPYITKGNFLALSVRDKYFIYREKYGQSARLSDLKMKGSQLKVIFTVEADYKFKVEHLELKLRSSLENDSKVIDVEKMGDLYSAKIDLSSMELKEFYYEAFAVLKFEDGGIGYSRLEKPTKFLKTKINKSIFNFNFEHKSSHSVDYPFITNRNVLYIAHRVRSSEESFKDKVNEWTAMAANKILKKWLSNKHIWLVFEKNSGTAQDNGYYFFKWMYENHPEKKVYYVIKKNSKDYDKLQGMRNRVLTYMSFKHLLYLAAAKLLIAPETRGHVFTWRQQKGRLRRVLDKKKLIFLQHGVTAFKHNDSVLDYNSPSAVTKYVVTSQGEQQIIHEGLHYPKEDIFVTGFARWDALIDKSKDKSVKKIFVMPTWRGWLDSVPRDEFVKTMYYDNYMKLLNSKKLNNLLISNNVILEFFLHPKFKEYTSNFKSNLSNIKILDFNKVQVNEKLMESSLLITDYSSVSWDMHYLNKPVLFYQFDYQDYMNLTGSYIDIKKNLFGNSSSTIDELIDQVQMVIKNNFVPEEKFEILRDKNFAFIDVNNSKRIFEEISKSNLGD